MKQLLEITAFLVRKMNLKFPIDNMWPKRGLLQRWAARVVAKMLIKSKGESYQCSGEINWHLFPNRADVQVPATQLAHWVLREAGYSVCEADIMKRIGLSPDRKDREEGRDSVEQSSG